MKLMPPNSIPFAIHVFPDLNIDSIMTAMTNDIIANTIARRTFFIIIIIITIAIHWRGAFAYFFLLFPEVDAETLITHHAFDYPKS